MYVSEQWGRASTTTGAILLQMYFDMWRYRSHRWLNLHLLLIVRKGRRLLIRILTLTAV